MQEASRGGVHILNAGSERRNEGLCLRCAKEMGLPQVDEYLKQMGISEEDFENAYDSMFDENGNPRSGIAQEYRL